MLTDRAVLDLFLSQHGVATVDQLRRHGVHRASAWRATKRGELTEMLPRVLRLASAPDTFELRSMAVQLQSAPEGYLAAFTAARLLGLWEMPDRPIYVTVPRRLPGNRPHCHQRVRLPRWVARSESNWHNEGDVVIVGSFRVERPASMLFTIAARSNDLRFERIAEKAWHLGLITPTGVQDYVDRYRRRGRSGVTRTLRWLDKVGDRSRAMQSNFEVDILHAIRRAGLPEPAKQFPLRLATGETIHLDLAWVDVRLAVEPGHSRWHGGTLATLRDEGRDRACRELGWEVKRYTEDARRDLAAVGRELRRLHRERATNLLRSGRAIATRGA